MAAGGLFGLARVISQLHYNRLIVIELARLRGLAPVSF
jgi:hypothetical protein